MAARIPIFAQNAAWLVWNLPTEITATKNAVTRPKKSCLKNFKKEKAEISVKYWYFEIKIYKNQKAFHFHAEQLNHSRSLFALHFFALFLVKALE